MKILNVDLLKEEEKKVTLNGIEYVIPADMPVKIMLRMMKNSSDLQENSQDAELLEESVRIIYDLFRTKTPGIEWESFDMSIAQYVKIVNFIGNVSDEDAGEPEKKTANDIT